MRARWEKVRKILRQEGAQALLVINSEGSGQPATRWLCGFTGTASLLLILEKDSGTPTPRGLGTSPLKRGRGESRAVLITDGRYTEQAKREAGECKVLICDRHTSYIGMVRKVLKREKIKTVLIDGSVTAYSTVEELTTTPQSPPWKGGEEERIKVISRKRLLQEVRVVKDRVELKLLTNAADIACRAFLRLLPEIQIGMSEKEVADKLQTLCVEEGGEGEAFPTIVASGIHAASAHAHPTDKKLKSGELVVIDFGVRYKGYVSDMTRTIAMGKISARLRRIYSAVQGAQEHACRNIQAGMSGEEIDALCRDYLRKKGLEQYFIHATGHGIGMEVHEMPSVSPRPNHPSYPLLRKGGEGKRRKGDLPEGAVITCEPGVYIPRLGGVRIEDTLILTKKGNVNLQERVSKKLISLPASNNPLSISPLEKGERKRRGV